MVHLHTLPETTMIYVLTAGEYSDYHIKGVFTDRALAEKAQKLVPDSSIEEYEPDVIPDHPPDHTAWGVRITNGMIDYSYQEDAFGRFEPRMHHYNYNNEGITVVTCWATDEEHAKKIALDKYYQWKYEQEQGK